MVVVVALRRLAEGFFVVALGTAFVGSVGRRGGGGAPAFP